jgi:prophage antirepressor-like protein
MLIQFENQEVEIIYINNEPFFKVKDVCKILGFKNPRDALNTHCEKEGVASADTLTSTGKKKANFINEPNLYALIFNVPKIFHTDTEQEKENKIKAEKFKRFVFNEVIPSIRKTGTYSIAKKFEAVEHTKRETQVENSKKINALNYEKGGVELTKEYNRESCKQLTGYYPNEWRKTGEKIGLKTADRNSAKQVFRNIPNLKKYACALSVSDSLAQQGYDLSTTTKIAKSSLELFDNLIKIGVEIKN